MKVAIVDCGTNTFHLLIVEINEDGDPQKLFETKAMVKLGQDGITKQFISQQPFERGIAALAEFSRLIKEYKVEEVKAFATAALRNARNGNDFIAAAKLHTGISIELINGEREAELIYLGVKQALDLGDEISLVMDIGGGSTELIICNSEKIFWLMSFPLGAALLLEQLQPSDPIKPIEIEQLNAYLELILAPLIEACFEIQPKILVGSSGSFESFAEMIEHSKSNEIMIESKKSYDFVMEDYSEIHRILVQSSLEERLNMQGLVKMRADMIVLSSLLLTFVLSRIKIESMKLSTFALKEGMMAELSNQY